MSSFARIFWLVVLLFFVSGCATYKGAVLPGQAVAAQGGKSSDTVVQKGMAIRVTLVDGTNIAGDVIRVSELELVVGTFGNYGLERRTIASSDIHAIEVEKYSRTEETIAKSAAIVVVVGIIGLAVFAYSLRGLGDLN